MDTEKLKCLQFQPDARLRSQRASWTIFALVGIVAVAAEFKWTRARERLDTATGAPGSAPALSARL